jgi:mannose-1-phosphate guanylyltransferase
MTDTNAWVTVLAGGDGTRLRALTTAPCGTPVPKQYCTLHGTTTLIEDALDRGRSLAAEQRICAIVADHHRRWWSQVERLKGLPAGNVMVQPRNRGTGIGVLYAMLHILAKDPDAQVVLLPADHYVEDKRLLREAILIALAHIAADDERPVLLGLEPEDSDTELGYIVPGADASFGARDVSRFIEKPTAALAGELIAQGALWNAFIIVASARSLVNLFTPRYAPIALEMQVIISRSLEASEPAAGWPALVDMYQRLPQLDFSRDVLEGRESSLCVLAVPPCGWSDLGTPQRVARTLRRTQPEPVDAEHELPSVTRINLAAEHARMERAVASRAPM